MTSGVSQGHEDAEKRMEGEHNFEIEVVLKCFSHLGDYLGFLHYFADLPAYVEDKQGFHQSVLLISLGLFLRSGLFEGSGGVGWFALWFRG